MKKQIWASFLNIKYKAYLISILVSKYQKWDRNINIFLALAASSSVGSWVIWNTYEILWSSIIVGSQVLNVIKPYIPYFKYVKELNQKSQNIDELAIKFEELWFKFSKGKLSQDDSAEVYFKLKRAENEVLNFSDDIVFSTSKRDEDKANKKMKTFIMSNYGIEIEINAKK